MNTESNITTIYTKFFSELTDYGLNEISLLS